MSSPSRFAPALAAAFAGMGLLLLPACTRDGVVDDTPPPRGAPATSGQPATSQQPNVVDQAGVPSPDEAYDSVSGEITQDNVDAELQRLMQEIEGDS